jgi:transitional endoplasmic reticulum ATPase
MDGMNQKKIIFIICATNRSDQMFLSSRAALNKSPASPDVDLGFSVKVTRGFSSGDLTNLASGQPKSLSVQQIFMLNVERERAIHEEVMDAEDPVPITR